MVVGGRWADFGYSVVGIGRYYCSGERGFYIGCYIRRGFGSLLEFFID